MTRMPKKSAAHRALGAAKRELIRRHQSEYETLHGDFREKFGLPRNSESSVDKLRDRVSELEEENAKLRGEKMTDVEIAQKMKDGGDLVASGGDETPMLEAENLICERLNIPLDETELGLTRKAVEQIEEFVSTHLGKPWSYQDAGMLGVDGAR